LSGEEQSTHQISEFPYRTTVEPTPVTRELVASSHAVEPERSSFEQGYREGERAALDAAEQRLAPARERLEESIRQLSSLRQYLYRHAEQELVKLSFAIAAKLVRREIRLDPDIVATLVRISLEKVSQASTARVRLNPDDYRYLAAAHAEGADSGFGAGVVLVEDVNVEPGGCVVETDAGNVDARVDVQLQEIAENLLSTF
jgi:flagellar assembly protein FliH